MESEVSDVTAAWGHEQEVPLKLENTRKGVLQRSGPCVCLEPSQTLLVLWPAAERRAVLSEATRSVESLHSSPRRRMLGLHEGSLPCTPTVGDRTPDRGSRSRHPWRAAHQGVGPPGLTDVRGQPRAGRGPTLEATESSSRSAGPGSRPLEDEAGTLSEPGAAHGWRASQAQNPGGQSREPRAVSRPRSALTTWPEILLPTQEEKGKPRTGICRLCPVEGRRGSALHLT